MRRLALRQCLWRRATAEDAVTEQPYTFPRLLCDPGERTACQAGVPGEGSGHLQTWTWAQVAASSHSRLRLAARASSAATASRSSATTGRACNWGHDGAQAWRCARALYQTPRSRNCASLLQDAISARRRRRPRAGRQIAEVLPQCPQLKHILFRRPRRAAPLRTDEWRLRGPSAAGREFSHQSGTLADDAREKAGLPMSR